MLKENTDNHSQSMTYPSTSSGHQQQQQNHTIVQMPQQPVPPPLPQEPSQPNRPSLDLLHGNEYIKIGVPLYKAAIKGDWKAAKRILDQKPDLIRFAITEKEETLLHVAASAERTKAVEEFVINLVNMMEKADLELQNKSGDTALSIAAQAGNIETAKALAEKNPTLIKIPNKSNAMPLYMAVEFAKPNMVSYLYNKMSGDFWSHGTLGLVLQKCVEADMFDVAIKIVKDHPELMDSKCLLMEVLLALAQKPNAFEVEKQKLLSRLRTIKLFNDELLDMSMRLLEVLFDDINMMLPESEALQLLKLVWKKIAKMPRNDIDDIFQGPLVMVEKENKEKEREALPLIRILLEKMDKMPKSETEKENKNDTDKNNKIETYPSRILFVATKMGNTRFIVELIRLYPDVIWQQDDKGKTIFHLAIKHRQENIYNLLYELGGMKDLICSIEDKKGNNMLHMVAKIAKQTKFQRVYGVPLQIQREFLWFKEVEKMIPPQYRKRMNQAGETPQQLFTKTHADLVANLLDWINNTISQCMVVATLTATITFAAAFTLPGGYNQETGIPFFRKEPALIIFVISDAISLIYASSSILRFLSIYLTSSYSESEFLESLPNKLTSGIGSLFESIVWMLVAFCASFFVLYDKKLGWVPVVITTLASMPFIRLIERQFHVIRNVFDSTYLSRYLFKPKRHVLYG